MGVVFTLRHHEAGSLTSAAQRRAAGHEAAAGHKTLGVKTDFVFTLPLIAFAEKLSN